MESVICDTNIWYDLANKKYDKSLLNQDQLIGTSINLREIASSPYLISNLNMIVEAVKSITKFHDKIFIDNPMDHIITIFNKDYVSNSKTEEDILNGFTTLLNMNLDDIPVERFKEVKRRLNNITVPSQNLVDQINDGLPAVNQRIKRSIGKQKHRQSDHTMTWKKFISELVSIYSKENCKKEYVIDIYDERWNSLELFITIWERYFNKLEIEKRKIRKNDWADLFNLVYVQPGYKYWTSDEIWNIIIDENEHLKKYKYNYGTQHNRI